MISKSFYVWEKVEDDDPNRCQGMDHRHTHQCHYKAVPGSKYCPRHYGSFFKEEKIRRMHNYQLTKFKARAQRLQESENIGSLKDEVAILRMLIEERLNRCNDENDLLLMSGPISDLLMKSEKLVTSMTKLEEKLGEHLNKDKIIQFAQLVIEVISKYIENPEILDAIGEDILNALKIITEIKE